MQYAELVAVYERLESTSKRLEKTFILSEFLRKADDEKVLLLAQGRVFPNWDQRELGMASKLLVKAISVASGASAERIEATWNATGDLGKAAAELVGKKSQATLFSQPLSCPKVFDNLRKIAEMEGEGTVDRKVQLVAELLTSAQPNEAKYVIRTILQELRIGLGEGTLRDSIVWAFFGSSTGAVYDKEKNELIVERQEEYDLAAVRVQEALDMLNDFVDVARKARLGVLEQVSVIPGRPVKAMLFQKAKDIVDGFSIVGKPAAVEFKYDGFRLQIHKSNGKIALFTRRLENVTAQFPDVVECVGKHVRGGEFIIDAEAVGIDAVSKKYLPFQSISQRIKRKYDIHELARLFPVEVNVFDVLFAGKSLLKSSFAERRKAIESMVDSVQYLIKPAEHLLTDDQAVAYEFYRRSLSAGNEGVMMKNLQEVYKPGSRVGFGVKVKPVMDTLEVVIVGAEWGEGKRGKWLASFIVAVRDDAGFVEIGRVGTGIKEKIEEGVSFDQLTQLLLPLIVSEDGRGVKVKPRVVIEVDYEEIQKSPTYSSGFALRFPRFVRLREDRAASDVNTREDLIRLADGQRGRGEQ
ncbi:ATP-dependent DNA ligase [Candidatus Woesearchaeota archaeon]|nr:ATP-dependent DNA ligase [Candidatus Woesearchaeota archaeon]